MKTNSIANLDWPRITADLEKEGYALLPKFLDAERAKELAQLVLNSAAKSPQKSLGTFELGRGALWQLTGSLPDPLAVWRETFYEQLAPIASHWNKTMGTGSPYPGTLTDFLREDRETLQGRSHATLSRLREGDYQALHQSTGGKQTFPLQLMILLSEPDSDFTGGELVMTEQRPRMQSRPMVLPLRLGDAALITVAHRPFKGTKGYYRVNLKHAISRVHGGERLGLELLFHDVLRGHANG
jgi:uncharacterized protein